ncbi:aminoglycoside phosphotransferase family protein [Dorea sp. YH-dor228]|uniref:phosphotransferase enzyme family protein n=1 Tax=Dorea sp. YH-dor228 TaxID=3151120 RepID=UPI003242E79B
MALLTQKQKDEAIANFQFEGILIEEGPYGSGHINDTFLLKFEIAEMGCINVILQRMNKDVFSNPVELMENIMGVTSYLRKKIIENGGDPERETLNVIPAVDGKPYYLDSQGDYWRSYKFITDATSYDQVEKPEHFYQSAVAFGNFQRLLADYPAETLHETIKGFHNTKARFAVFKKAVEEDVMGRASQVQKEIQFVLDRENIADYFTDLLEKGELPLRVTHNDTKLNNIMIDNKTGRGICVIDLDTVMPGLAMNDFGDSIRFGASTAAEDERDLDKVSCSMELFDLYAKGFIEGCAEKLTAREIELMPMGAKSMTFECGMRFLTDYLQGDNYFKIHREGQNLDRCRTQFKLVEDMEQKWDTMQEIVKKYSNC